MADTYQRRQGYVDYPVQVFGQKQPQVQNGTAADLDYFRNLKKFERHDDMAAEPTRDKNPPSKR